MKNLKLKMQKERTARAGRLSEFLIFNF